MKKDKWSGQVDIGSGQVVFLSTCPTGQVDIKVNVEPCTWLVEDRVYYINTFMY